MNEKNTTTEMTGLFDMMNPANTAPDYGSNEELDRLVDACQMEGIATEEELDDPCMPININEIDDIAEGEAKLITERLSGYYFDQKYIDTHPYIPIKIKTEMDNIRRLIKMLHINEHAQDALIRNISFNAGKGSLYSALTSLQNSTLSIQSQLNTLTQTLEDIFRKMQDECERSWTDKEKEQASDGTVIVRGAREFIEMLTREQNTQTNSAALA